MLNHISLSDVRDWRKFNWIYLGLLVLTCSTFVSREKRLALGRYTVCRKHLQVWDSMGKNIIKLLNFESARSTSLLLALIVGTFWEHMASHQVAETYSELIRRLVRTGRTKMLILLSPGFIH